MPDRALVIHGGGPTPVINASLAGVVEATLGSGRVGGVLGARFGIRGLIAGHLVDVGAQPRAVLEQLPYTPGSVLGSCRAGAAEEEYPGIVEVLREHSVRFVFFNGGNGTMYAAERLLRACREHGYPAQVIGIPKTIDNDLGRTDHAPGYASAARFIACAARDVGGDLWSLRQRVTVLESMGRNAGWIVGATALARSRPDDPPHLIYVPERPVSADRLLGDVERVYRRLDYCVVAVCEGQTDDRGEAFGAEAFLPDGYGRRLSANLGQSLAQLIALRLKLRARSEKPGLLGRSSPLFVPDLDREEALECGRAAVRAALEGENGVMITLDRAGDEPYRSVTGTAPLGEVAAQERRLPDEFVADADVTEAFLCWVKPLAGSIPPRVRLEA